MLCTVTGAKYHISTSTNQNIISKDIPWTKLGSDNDQGVPTDPKRIKVIPDWPTPSSIREIWGCHDLTNFYKRFVPYFFILVAPLIELVRNHVPSWEDAQERDFQTLPYSNIANTTNIYVSILFTGVEGRSPKYQESRDFRSNLFQGYWIEDSKRIGLELLKKALGFS